VLDRVSEVLDRLTDILGLGLDLIGGAVGLELVVIGDVADGLLGASAEVFGLVLELVVNTHGRLLHRLLCRLHCRMLQCCGLFRASHSTPLRLRTGGVETDMQGLLSSAPASRSPGPLRPPTGRRARWRRGTGGPSAGCPSRSSPWHRTRFPPPAWARARTAAPV